MCEISASAEVRPSALWTFPRTYSSQAVLKHILSTAGKG